MYAASRGNESLVLYLLKLHADRNIRDANGDKACDWAKKNAHQSIYMILICDPKVSTVHSAIREGNVEATVAFFKQNPNPNQRWYLNQFHPSAGEGSSNASGITSPSGAAVVHPTMAIEGVLDGEPPLVVAAKFNRVAIINILLRAPGIDVDILDTFGKTPLMHAAEHGHEETVCVSPMSCVCYTCFVRVFTIVFTCFLQLLCVLCTFAILILTHCFRYFLSL